MTATHDSGPALRAVPAPPKPVGRPGWERSYALSLAALDLIVIGVASLIAFELRLGDAETSLVAGGTTIPYGVVVGAPGAALAAPAARQPRLRGPLPRRRLGGVQAGRATRPCASSPLLASSSFALKAQFARGFVAVVVPARLRAARARPLRRAKGPARAAQQHGVCVHRVVLVGSRRRDPRASPSRSTASRSRDWTSSPSRCPTTTPKSELAVGGPDAAQHRAGSGHGPQAARGRAPTPSRSPAPRRCPPSSSASCPGTSRAPAPTCSSRRPSPTSPARASTSARSPGCRCCTWRPRPSAAPRRVLKRLIDIAGAAAAAARSRGCRSWSSPSLIKAGGPRQPVFFRQERVGRDGSAASRSGSSARMRAGARTTSSPSCVALNESDGPLFKLRQRPAGHPGRRRPAAFSLDELPQLFNVLGGSMSLVGPRPPLPTEVDDYDDHVHRRLLVKPGMTGLWQVSGRVRPALGGVGPPRPLLRRELVGRPRRPDPLEDAVRGREALAAPTEGGGPGRRSASGTGRSPPA